MPRVHDKYPLWNVCFSIAACVLKATIGIHNSFLFHCRFEDMTVADLRQMFTSKYICGGGARRCVLLVYLAVSRWSSYFVGFF